VKDKEIIGCKESQQNQAGCPSPLKQRINRISEQPEIKEKMNQSKNPIKHQPGSAGRLLYLSISLTTTKNVNPGG